jgi:hypothetical protein
VQIAYGDHESDRGSGESVNRERLREFLSLRVCRSHEIMLEKALRAAANAGRGTVEVLVVEVVSACSGRAIATEIVQKSTKKGNRTAKSRNDGTLDFACLCDGPRPWLCLPCVIRKSRKSANVQIRH